MRGNGGTRAVVEPVKATPKRSKSFPFSLFPLHVLLAACTCVAQVVPPYPVLPRPVDGSPSFVIVGDTQTPLWFEKLWVKSDRNEEIPPRIFQSIARDSTVAAVFHLGDLTALGSLSYYWDDFDDASACLRSAHIPIYPAYGNHEYLPFASMGRTNMTSRFPFMATSWYCTRIGHAAIVILNSNFSHLAEDEIGQQQHWYAGTLRQLDQDTTVIVTIVTCHHPPYTNSTIIDPSPRVEHDFVHPFLHSLKAKLFVSGHAHAFEHFHVEGKDFLVAGGGGGLLHPLLQGDEQRVRDQYPHGSSPSFFHYLRFSVDSTSLRVQTLRVWPDHPGIDTVYTLQIAVRQ